MPSTFPSASMCFLSPETIKSAFPVMATAKIGSSFGIGGQVYAWRLVKDKGTRANVVDNGRRFNGVEKISQAGPGENIGYLDYLRSGRYKLDLAALPCLIQPVRRGAFGDKGTDQDVGIKNDPHARRPPPRQSDRGFPAGHVGYCGS